MTVKELYAINEKFQQNAAEIAELIPGGALLEVSTKLIRGVQRMDRHLMRILEAKVEVRFFQAIELLEEEMDEIIYLLDKVDDSNRITQLGSVTDLLKRGYELLSLYSLCCDQLLEKNAKSSNEI